MMPLWRITEDEGHILEMNEHYDKLERFLDECQDVEKTTQFMEGNYVPFDEIKL